MFLPHTFLKSNPTKDKPLSFTKKDNIKRTTLREIVATSLYSKPTFFQGEKLGRDKLLNIEDVFAFKTQMPKFVTELGEQALLMLEKRKVFEYTDNYKEQSLTIQDKNGNYLCDLNFVFFEEKEMFHVYLSVNGKEIEEQNFDKNVFIPRHYKQKLKGNAFTNEMKLKSFKLLPLIFNNYNFETKHLKTVEFNGHKVDHEWFKHTIVVSLLKFAKKPSLFLGEFKLQDVKTVYEKIFNLNKSKTIQAVKEPSLGLVLEELGKEFNLNRNTVNLFELCYLIGNSKTVYNVRLEKTILFIEKLVSNHEERIARLLDDNEKLETLEKALYNLSDTYTLRGSVKIKIEENLKLINSLSMKEEAEEVEVDYAGFISSLENKTKGKNEQDYGFLNMLLVLRMMNIIKFK